MRLTYRTPRWRDAAGAGRAEMVIINESLDERAYGADASTVRAQEMRRARPNLRLDILTQLMTDYAVDWVLLVDQHVMVTRFELGHQRVLGLESETKDERMISHAITTSERATIAHATSLMLHERVRQTMIVPDHQPARRFLADTVRALPGYELAVARQIAPTVGLYFTTAMNGMARRTQVEAADEYEHDEIRGHSRSDPESLDRRRGSKR